MGFLATKSPHRDVFIILAILHLGLEIRSIPIFKPRPVQNLVGTSVRDWQVTTHNRHSAKIQGVGVLMSS